MTANMIAYWSLNESMRHNAAVEKETVRHNLTTESETSRHNLATESANRDALAETARHNLAVETEAHRSNLAREVETHRTNLAYETEMNRHNLAVETETHRTNVANEAIKRESNKIGWANVSLGYAQLSEATRHNKASEANQASQIAEAARHNEAMEKQAAAQLRETTRTNLANEAIDREYKSGMLDYYNTKSDRDYSISQNQLGIEWKRAEETERHNLATEGIAQQDADTRAINAAMGMVDTISSESREWFKSAVGYFPLAS